MAHIASLDSVRVDAPTILYALDNSWYLEIPVLNLKFQGDSPQELRSHAQKFLASEASTSHSARLEAVKELIEASSRTVVASPPPEESSGSSGGHLLKKATSARAKK